MRVYEIDGKQYYSVTTIIGMLDKPALVGWAAKMTAVAFKGLVAEALATGNVLDLDAFELQAKRDYRKQSETAMSYGTAVHEMIEQYCKDGITPWLDDKPPEVQTAWAAWMAWVEEHDYEPLSQELQVCNTEIGYAGRFDAVANVNGVCTIVDFKTSSGFYGDEYLYQLAAYWMAAPEEFDIQQGGILRLDKITGLPEWKTYSMDDLTYGWEVFKLLTKAYRLINGDPKPKKERKNNGVNN